MSTESVKPDGELPSAHSELSKATESPWTEPNGIVQEYGLHCHCGAVRFKMKISPPLYEEQAQGKEQCVAIECDCSHCERTGFWAVHPLAKDVEWTGLEHRGEYRFGNKKNQHYLCKLCGNVLATDLTYLMNLMKMENRLSVNVRMLKDFDRTKLKTRRLEMMKDMPPKYSVD